MTFEVGLDLGQASDFSAVAILERFHAERVWAVRNLARFPLGTPYTEIVEQIRLLMKAWPLRDSAHLVVDGTGVGRPVLDLLKRAGLGHRLFSVTIHGGDRVTPYSVGNGYGVPKRDLVSTLQLLLQQGRFKIAAGLLEEKAFFTELAGFGVRISERGHDTYGAGRANEHDDLVNAVALACWHGQRRWALPPGPPEVVPEVPRGKVDEFFEFLQAEERRRNPDFFVMGDYRLGGPSRLPRSHQTRPGITGTVSHVIRTKGEPGEGSK
jgi:hypothetical protein